MNNLMAVCASVAIALTLAVITWLLAIRIPSTEPAPEVTYSTPQGTITEVTIGEHTAYLYGGRLYWSPND